MNQNNLNLNIILPTYNEEKNLEFIIPEILDLLKKRKYESCEITVVDDNSNDDTANVVKKLMKNNPNLFLIERKGKSSANGMVNCLKKYHGNQQELNNEHTPC